MPYFDSSGWFLIEKTTILTNSCCLHVQPTFGDSHKKKQYNFSALPYPIGQSLLYPPVLTVIPGQFVILHKFVPNCAFFGLCHSAIKKSRVQIFDLATTLTYEREPTAVVVALYRRLEQLGYEVNRCLWWWPSAGDLNNYSTLVLFFSLQQDFD